MLMTQLTPEARAVATYNAAADHFDAAPLSFWSRYGARTVARLKLSPGAAVLDVGCGSGASVLPAARKVGPTGHVTGVDLSECLLELAQAKAQRAGLDNTTFVCADMQSLPYGNARFDAIVCVFALFFVPDMAGQVAELWRMLRPGGVLAVTTWGPNMLAPGSALFWSAVERHCPELYGAYRPWNDLVDADAVAALLADGGAHCPAAVAEPGRQELLRPEDWWTIVLGSGFRWTVDQMGPALAARVREDNVAALRRAGTTEVATNVIYATARKP